jgi:RES domain-containing protein
MNTNDLQRAVKLIRSSLARLEGYCLDAEADLEIAADIVDIEVQLELQRRSLDEDDGPSPEFAAAQAEELQDAAFGPSWIHEDRQHTE